MAEYIEREALMADIMNRYCMECDNANGIRCLACWVDDMNGEIVNAPAADVAPVVHGRWEDVRENVSILRCSGFPMTTTAETCTVCRFRSCFVGPKSLLHDGICPNCGAKMDGEAQHE